MNVAIIIPPTDFRDETVAKALELLKKWDVTPTIASYTKENCVGNHGAVYSPKIAANGITTDSYDALFIADGPGLEAYKLYDLRSLLDIIKHFKEKGKPIVSIGNATKILARANVISGVKVAPVKDEESMRLIKLFRGVIGENKMESDSNILTASTSEQTYEVVNALLEKLGVK